MATCLDYSLRYIHLYPKTEQELRLKLLTKKYSEDEIEKVMNILKKKWYIDDIQFTKLYIQSEIVKKWKIPQQVKNKLLQKGVDKNIIQDIMNSCSEDMEVWVHNRILKEVDKLKKKWLEWYDIIVKIAQKWYHLSDIKKALRSTEE